MGNQEEVSLLVSLENQKYRLLVGDLAEQAAEILAILSTVLHGGLRGDSNISE